MNRKNNRRKALWITLFVILIGLSGLGLAASGNFENPLAALVSGSGEGRDHDGPPAGVDNQATQEQPPAGAGQRGEGGDQSSINWSAIGSVLYNVWFLFAAAAVVIVIQTVGGGLVQMIRNRVPQTASP